MKKLGISIVVLAMFLAMIGGVNAQNVLFQDDFENIPVGAYPSANGWGNLFRGGSAYVSDEQANSGDKSFRLAGQSSWARVVYVPFSQPDRSSYEVYAFPSELSKVNAGGFAVARGSSGPFWNVVRFEADGSIIFDPNPPCPTNPQLISLQTYSPGRWYKIHVDLDYTTNTGDVYIDDVLKANDVGICPREFDAGGSYGWVTLDQFALSHGGYGYSNGPVYFDDVVLSDWSTILTIPASIDIDPDTLNLKSHRMGHHGKWITAYIELPEGYDVADINVSMVLLNDAISAELRPSNIGDYDRDDIPDLMVKFNRADVIDLIKALNLDLPADVELTVTGSLTDGKQFEGTDTISVIEEGRHMVRKRR